MKWGPQALVLFPPEGLQSLKHCVLLFSFRKVEDFVGREEILYDILQLLSQRRVVVSLQKYSTVSRLRFPACSLSTSSKLLLLAIAGV